MSSIEVFHGAKDDICIDIDLDLTIDAPITADVLLAKIADTLKDQEIFVNSNSYKVKVLINVLSKQ